MIKTKKEFKKAIQDYHLAIPKLHNNFQDNFSDKMLQKWNDLDEALLNVYHQVLQEDNIDTNGDKIK